MSVEIITAANGFIGGQLNLAHAASTYVPADIRYRLATRFRDPDKVRFSTGLDVHGRRAGRLRPQFSTSDEMTHFFAEGYRTELAKLSIFPTHFVSTDDTELPNLVAFAVRRLIDTELISKSISETLWCEVCDDGLSKLEVEASHDDDSPVNLKSCATLSDKSLHYKCKVCGMESVGLQRHPQYVLKLPRSVDLQNALEASAPPILKKVLRGIFEGDFSEWGITRANYYGMAMPDEPELSLYLWFDSLIAKLLPLETDATMVASSMKDTQYVCFLGKNIIPYYSLVLPLLISKGFGAEAANLNLSVRGYCDFGKSGKILDLDHALSIAAVDELRFFSAYSVRDDIHDFILSEERLKQWRESIIKKTFGRYLKYLTTWLRQNATDVPSKWPNERHPSEPVYRELIYSNRLRGVLLKLETLARQGLENPPTKIDIVLSEYRLLYDLLGCYMPEMIKQFAAFRTDKFGRLIPGQVLM